MSKSQPLSTSTLGYPTDNGQPYQFQRSESLFEKYGGALLIVGVVLIILGSAFMFLLKIFSSKPERTRTYIWICIFGIVVGFLGIVAFILGIAFEPATF